MIRVSPRSVRDVRHWRQSVIPAALLFAGCAGPQVTIDHAADFEFAQLKSWNWAAQSGSLETPAATKTSERIRLDSIVRRHVDAALAQKGYVRNLDKADFTIAWSFGEWEFQRHQNSASHYGAVGLYYPGMHASNVHRSTDGRALPPSSDPYSNRSEEAKFDLVIIDARTQRVIWHGNATDKSDFGYYTSAQTREIGDAIDGLLNDFPPTR